MREAKREARKRRVRGMTEDEGYEEEEVLRRS